MADDPAKPGATGPGPTGGTKFSFEEFGRRVEGRINDALPVVEAEVKRVIAYLNDEVVPQVRQNSSSALKIAAEHLSKLAEHLDSKGGPGKGGV